MLQEANTMEKEIVNILNEYEKKASKINPWWGSLEASKLKKETSEKIIGVLRNQK